MSQYAFLPRVFGEAVEHARIVVADCNLAVDQLLLVVEAAGAARCPVVLAAVSDSKVHRIAQLPAGLIVDLVCLNELELQALGFAMTDPMEPARVQEICLALRARKVIVTQGMRGHVALDAAGQIERFPAPDVETIVSTSGAGDALLAGLVVDWYRNGRLDVAGAQTTVARLVRRVLEQPGATVGSLAAEADFAKLAQIAMREEPVMRRFMTPEVGVAAAVVTVLVTLVVGLLQVWAARAGPADNKPAVPSLPAGVVAPSPPAPSSSVAPAPPAGASGAVVVPPASAAVKP